MSLATCKLQQSLKIKEEKITELETKYALTPSFITFVYQSITGRAAQIVVHCLLVINPAFELYWGNIARHPDTNRAKPSPYN